MLDLLVDSFARRGCGLLLSGASVTGGDWLAQWAKSGRVDGIIVIGQSDHVALFRSEDGRAAPVVVWVNRTEKGGISPSASTISLAGRWPPVT